MADPAPRARTRPDAAPADAGMDARRASARRTALAAAALAAAVYVGFIAMNAVAW